MGIVVVRRFEQGDQPARFGVGNGGKLANPAGDDLGSLVVDSSDD